MRPTDAESISMSELLAMADGECKDLWRNLRLTYTETAGLPLLREEYAKEYGLNAENVLCFAGSEEGIFCTLQTLLKEGDHAIVVTPCYQSLLSVTESLVSVSTISLSLPCRAAVGAVEENNNNNQTTKTFPKSSSINKWTLDLEKLRTLIRPNETKMIIVNFPHNPTGTSLSAAEQQQLISLAREFNLYLMWDEVYRGVEQPNPQSSQLQQQQQLPYISANSVRDSLAPAAALYPKAISVGGTSKAYGLAGLRVGWICSQNLKALKSIADSKHYLSICNSGPSEVLALIAARNRNKIFDRNQAIIQRNVQLIQNHVDRNSDRFDWTPPVGGCSALVRVNYFPKDLDNIDSFAEKLITEYGILILPASHFLVYDNQHLANELATRYFRIGFAREAFPAALEAFENACKEMFRD